MVDGVPALAPSKSLSRRATFSIIPPPFQVSAVLIVLNGERILDRVLSALSFCDEILILDSGSTDGTLACAAKHGARVVQQPFLGYGAQKRRAVELAKHDWILSIDDDEVLDYTAAAAIQAVDLNQTSCAWRVRRRNYVGMREIRYGQWAPDYSLRLFNRRFAQFNDATIHESVQTSGRILTLEGALHHYSFMDLGDVFSRAASYSRLKAKHYRAQGRQASAIQLLVRCLWGFFRSYVLKLGFRDGAAGVIVAASVALDGVLGLAMAGEAEPVPPAPRV